MPLRSLHRVEMSTTCPRVTAATLLACLLAAAAGAQAAGPVLIPPPETHLLQSDDGAEHQLFVSLPLAYEREPEASFPVLYLLDANTMFAMAAQTYGYREAFGALEPVIIVGIGYPVDDWDEVLLRRTHDMTPSRDAQAEQWWADRLGRDSVTSGGGDAYLAFLQTHVIPLIEATYRTSETRVLGGFSYGGLFAAHVLFNAPETFSGYLVGSPSLGWDDGVTFSAEEAFSARSSLLPVRVFLSSGGLEEATLNGVRRLGATIASRGYDGLDLTVHVFDDETHLSVIPATIGRGLGVLFAAPKARTE